MRHLSHGISGFDDWKFWAALFCYAATLPLFFQGGLTWDNFQVLMPLAISFVLVSTLAWDYRIIGNPRDLHCLILHIAFAISLVFLLNRLVSIADFGPLTRGGPDLSGLIFSWMNDMPYLGGIFKVFDFVLKWLGFALVLFMIAVAIMFPPRVAVSLLFICGLLVVAISVGQSMNAGVYPLFLGLALLYAAFRLQRVDEHAARFWNQVAERLARSGPRPRMDMRIKIAMLRELNTERALPANRIRGLVASELSCDTADPRLNPVCSRLTDQLINHDHIAESREGMQGWRCVLAIPEEEPDFFTTTARVVRLLVTLGFCLIYILSPIDFIPDATPVFGVVDDMLLGVVCLLSAIRTIYGRNRVTDWAERKLPF